MDSIKIFENKRDLLPNFIKILVAVLKFHSEDKTLCIQHTKRR